MFDQHLVRFRTNVTDVATHCWIGYFLDCALLSVGFFSLHVIGSDNSGSNVSWPSSPLLCQTTLPSLLT